MALLRSLAFALIFYAGTLVAVLIALITTWLGGQQSAAVGIGWARFHGWCARVLLGITPRIEGALPTGPVLVAAKHESMYETVALFALLRAPAVVVKRELADIPGWGRAARRYGVIPVDRTASAGALRRMIHAAAAAKAAGRTILIFPEGTRVPHGEAPPLRPGFAGLYRTLGWPVVPIALDAGRLWPRGFVKRPGIITLRFGDPIAPGLPRDEIEARVHAAINALGEQGRRPVDPAR